MTERATCNTRKTLDRVIEALSNSQEFGLDTEYSGPNLVHLSGKHASTNALRSQLAGVSVALPELAWYIPVNHQVKNLSLAEWQRFLRFLEDYQGTIWIHNLKAELLSMRQSPIPWDWSRSKARLGCTQVLAHLSQMSVKGSHKLKDLTRAHLGMNQMSFDEVTKGRPFNALDPTHEKPLRYACEDAEGALALAPLFLSKLLPGQEEVYWDREVWVQHIFRDMEDNGIALDRPVLREALGGFQSRLDKLVADWEFLVPGVSIGSSKQLQTLYTDGTWSTEDVPKNTQGHSTEKEYVERQMEKLPPGSRGFLAAKIKVEHSGLSKLISTYGEKMIEKADQYPDLRLHGGFNATGTATGRPSSSYPNLLNIPKHSNDGKAIRQAFVAREGWTLISCDYSQIELRILAHFMGSGGLYDVFHADGDPHQATADAAGVERQVGKFINFAVLYKVGAAKLALEAGTDYPGAQAIMRRFHKNEPGVAMLEETVLSAARARGYGRTLGGRHRLFPYIKSKNKDLRAYSERQAWNNPFQAGARDIMTRAMVDVWRLLDRDKARICLQIYDDLVVEVRDDYADEAHEIMQTAMPNAWKLRVPLLVSPARGKRWGDHK